MHITIQLYCDVYYILCDLCNYHNTAPTTERGKGSPPSPIFFSMRDDKKPGGSCPPPPHDGEVNNLTCGVTHGFTVGLQQ